MPNKSDERESKATEGSLRTLDDILERDQMLDAVDMVRALCMLGEEVLSKSLGYRHPNDCFCGYGGFNDGDGIVQRKTYDEGYRNDGAVLKFIVDATRKAIAENPYKPAEDDDD